MQKITLIGIYDQPPEFSERLKGIIASADGFAGGKRHHDMVRHALPDHARWVDIVAPLGSLFDGMRENPGHWVIFASGDPLFFGIGNTLKKAFPGAEMSVFPAFNALQLLGHRLDINYGEYPVISLTGRPWHAFDEALIQGKPRMGVLTDRNKTPAAIAERMLRYGYSGYVMHLGERMGGEQEQVVSLTLQEAKDREVVFPNCLFLEATRTPSLSPKGIPDEELEHLAGRPRMITKMPVRLTTLSLMNLHDKTVFWDIGACTGSISLEARLSWPHLRVTAFEKRVESEGIIRRNAEKFGALGIELVTGDYFFADKEDFETPDAVFLGGYGGAMEQLLDDVHTRLAKGGVLAFNAVSGESRERFIQWCRSNHYQLRDPVRLVVDDHNAISILVAVQQ
ncbi:MAG: precorrin-6y C5,15-methyltransferase (decarboxylating) subunit CbiE [Marinilabilia sp.]